MILPLLLASLLSAPVCNPSQLSYTASGGVKRAVCDKLSDVVSVLDNCGNSVLVDYASCIQGALDKGKAVSCTSGTYPISTSLYMKTSSQQFYGDCLITMSAALGKPALLLGASDSTGTPSSIVNAKVRGIVFQGSGTKTTGSAGIAFVAATTSTVDSIKSWGFAAGIDVRGFSLVNTIINPDLRQNGIGFYDKTDGTGLIDAQGSRILGGRIEQNDAEGVVTGTADLAIDGTTIEGNGQVTTTAAEVRITPGYQNSGRFACIDCHLEVTSSATSVFQVDSAACRDVELVNNFIAAGGAATHYIINTSSACTTQNFSIIGGRFSAFKNYINGAIANGSTAYVSPSAVDLSVDATTALTATGGASVTQFDRVLGFVTNAPIASNVASGSNAITFNTSGARLQLGTGASYLYSDGAGRVRSDGNLVAVSLIVNGGSIANNQAASVDIKGGPANGAAAIANRLGSANALSAAGASIACLYSDNFATKTSCFDLTGAFIAKGVTFANLATGTVQNGALQYCSDCTIANPCASGGTGAFAKRLNGVWVCN